MESQLIRFFKPIKSQILVLRTKFNKFPSISLTIPEELFRPVFISPIFLTAFACGFLFMAIAIVGSDLKSNLTKLNDVNQERRLVDAQIAGWKSTLADYQNYKDGYYMLANLEYRLGRKQKAFEYTNKALQIDPDYKEARELQIIISGK